MLPNNFGQMMKAKKIPSPAQNLLGFGINSQISILDVGVKISLHTHDIDAQGDHFLYYFFETTEI
jgi:hypothetical protein